MELKTFISETLTQILGGINDAQSKANTYGGEIVPINLHQKESGSLYGYTTGKSPIILVDFDVSVFAEKSRETKGGIGLSIGVIGLNSKGESNQQQNTTNKIKFQIPVALPLQK